MYIHTTFGYIILGVWPPTKQQPIFRCHPPVANRPSALFCFKPRLTNCPRFLHNGPVIWYKYRHQLGLESNMFFGLNQVGSRFSCAAKFTSRDPFDWPSSDSRNIGSTVRYITWIFEHLHKITSVWVGDIPEKKFYFPGSSSPKRVSLASNSSTCTFSCADTVFYLSVSGLFVRKLRPLPKLPGQVPTKNAILT